MPIIAQATANGECAVVVVVEFGGSPMPVASEIYDALRAFADAVTVKFAGAAAGEPEEQLRAPFEDLLQAAGAAMGRNIVCVGEVRLGHRLGKPDYGIAEGGLLTGYAELKAPGKGVVRRRFAGRDLEQFDRFTQLPNMLYSDGNEWALYRYGQRERPPVRLAGDVAAHAPRLTVTIARRELRAWLRDSPAGQGVEAVVKSLLAG